METKKDKIKILLIDSDEMMRIFFRDIFWIHGRNDSYEISMASSLLEASHMIEDKEKRPDTIFLDIMMPVREENNSPDGQIKRAVSFIEKIKNNKEFSHIKIIIYSGQKEESLKEEFKRLGVEGYLIKGELMPREIIAFTDKIHECNN